jgi:hypothetical protein
MCAEHLFDVCRVKIEHHFDICQMPLHSVETFVSYCTFKEIRRWYEISLFLT